MTTGEKPQSTLNGLPVWARVLFVVGPTALIAIFLVWKVVNVLPQIVHLQQEQQAEITRMHEQLTHHDRELEVIVHILQQVCANAAKDDDSRRRCYER